MYWTDAGTGKIQRAKLDATGVQDLVTTGLTHPGEIALDVAGGMMYWTDAGSSKIQRANLDGTSVEDLIITYSSGPMSGGGQRYGIALRRQDEFRQWFDTVQRPDHTVGPESPPEET
jgi:hypothetical protein